MKKILGKLSRSFHKEGKSLDEILPELRVVFSQIQINPSKDTDKSLNMIVNMSIDDLEFTYGVYRWASDNNYLTEQIATAMVRSLIKGGNLDGAISLIKGMRDIKLHVRTFIPLFHNDLTIKQYTQVLLMIRSNRIIPTDELFSLLVFRAPVDFGRDNFRSLIEWAGQHYDRLDTMVADSPILQNRVVTNLTNGVCQNCHTPICIIDLTLNQRRLMLESVFDKDTDSGIIRWIQTRDYSIVIDGANVAHYNNSPFDVRKVFTMVNKINHAYKSPKILLVFSICRKKQTQNLPGKWKNVDVYYTKSGTNDDLSWLYAALWYPNIWCITNDHMRDHIYYLFTDVVGRNVIDIWMDRNIVTFEFNIIRMKDNRNKVQIRLNTPLHYSIRPQINDNHGHIPISRNRWVCGLLN